MTRACIFIGPSLQLSVARQRCPQALWLPPAEQGSVVAAIEHHEPQVIAIIDGYFRHRASVWHKEILWALQRGVQVLGGGSMGALRAAELHAYGMQGIGEIFSAYRAGSLPPFDGLTDDDEVAVVHGPAETGYLAGSDALVNIRWTLRAALHARIIDTPLHDTLLAIARAMPFARRRYSTLLAAARPDVTADALQRLEHWLVDGRIDQKARDAAAVIDAVADALHGPSTAQQPNFELAEPELWHASLARGADAHLATPRSVDLAGAGNRADGHEAGSARSFGDVCEREERVLAALARNADAWQRVHTEALVFWLLHDRQNRQLDAAIRESATRASLRRQLDHWRQRHGLFDREAIDTWLADNDLPLHRIDALMAAEAYRDAVLPADDDPAIRRLMIERLKLCGDYARLAAQDP